MFVLALVAFIASGAAALYAGAGVWHYSHLQPRNEWDRKELNRDQLFWTAILIVAVLAFGFCGEALFL